MIETTQLLSDNILTSFWIAYGAGVLTSFTPCIYPLIPITVGVIGANTSSKLKGFLYSICYVTGLSFTYSCLGIIASLGGFVFGLTAYNPWVNLIVSLILFLFALNMFDIISLPLIGKAGFDASKYKKNVFGIFLMGIVSGFVAAPCSTPVLGGILTLVAVNKSVLTGGLLLFLYGFGCGTLLIVSGTFAGLASSLPKSGKWMNLIKKFFGIVIFLTAVYFLIRVFSGLG